MSPTYTQSEYLSILTSAPAEAVKLLAEDIIPSLGEITVIQNRTGLVMVPYTDSAQGKVFHLGEALVAESHIKIATSTAHAEGYAVCLGRDLEQSMAIALLDAALQAEIEVTRIQAFVAEQANAQQIADEELLKKVEATRVEMETF